MAQLIISDNKSTFIGMNEITGRLICYNIKES